MGERERGRETRLAAHTKSKQFTISPHAADATKKGSQQLIFEAIGGERVAASGATCGHIKLKPDAYTIYSCLPCDLQSSILKILAR